MKRFCKMLLPEFNYYRPESMNELLHLVQDLKSQSFLFSFLGGGTDLIPALKHHQDLCHHVISLSRLPSLRGIHIENKKKLVIGALTTLHELSENKLLQEFCSILAETASQVASPQIRFQATVGGNVLVDNRCLYFNQSEQILSSHGE